MINKQYMRLALQLAQKGCGYVNPNPMVGAVIVKDNRIISQGFHERYGELHAERNALTNCSESPKGATLYVTLEPCCHYGKTPPCTEAILESGISQVVIGSSDPNPIVAGKGVKLLRDNGILVIEGVLKEDCDQLNYVFFHYIKTKTPYVIMKYAMTMDGKIATHTGESRWITGEDARRNVHEDRHRYQSIMIGVGTLLTDNPLLSCRLENKRNPIRIVCDTNLRTPLSSQIVVTAKEIPTILATSCTETAKQKPYLEKGCCLIVVKKTNGHLDLKELMFKLGEKHIDSIFLEGGAALNWSALEAGIVNRIQAYIAPKLFGGDLAKSPIGGIGMNRPSTAFALGHPTITQIGSDLLIESEVIPKCLLES